MKKNGEEIGQFSSWLPYNWGRVLSRFLDVELLSNQVENQARKLSIVDPWHLKRGYVDTR